MNDVTAENRDSRNSRLRRLIGRRARHEGRIYEILEIIEDEPALVLQDESHSTIQADQHGEAHRRVPATVTVRLPLAAGGDIDFDAVDIEFLDTPPEAVDLAAD